MSKEVKLLMETFKRKLNEEWDNEDDSYDDYDGGSYAGSDYSEEIEKRGVPESIKSHMDFRFDLSGGKSKKYENMTYLGNLGTETVIFQDADGSFEFAWLDMKGDKNVERFQNAEEIPAFYEKVKSENSESRYY